MRKMPIGLKKNIKKNIKVYLNHGEAYGNLGDEAMLQNAIRKIESAIPNVEFVIPRREGAPLPDLKNYIEVPSPTLDVLELVRKIPRKLIVRLETRFPKVFYRLFSSGVLLNFLKSWRATRKALKSCDAVYCVGAANLNDYARYSHLISKCSLIELAKDSGIPVVVSSQTIGPLEMQWTRYAVARAITKATLFSVRDGGVSLQVMKGTGIDAKLLPFSGDEAFSLPSADSNDVYQYLSQQGIDYQKSFALFHFRSTDYTKETSHLYPKIAKALDQSDFDTQLLFFPMSYWTHSGKDWECGEEIRRHMKYPEKMFLLQPTQDTGLGKKLVGMSKWVIALSYHLQVFSLSEGVPFMIVYSGGYYEVKAKGVQLLVKGGVPTINLDFVSAKEFAQQISLLDSTAPRLNERITLARKRIMENNTLPIQVLLENIKG